MKDFFQKIFFFLVLIALPAFSSAENFYITHYSALGDASAFTTEKSGFVIATNTTYYLHSVTKTLGTIDLNTAYVYDVNDSCTLLTQANFSSSIASFTPIQITAGKQYAVVVDSGGIDSYSTLSQGTMGGGFSYPMSDNYSGITWVSGVGSANPCTTTQSYSYSILGLTVSNSTENVEPSFNASWTKWRYLNVTGNSGATVRVNVTYEAAMKTDFNDLRFTTERINRPLNYSIEQKADGFWAVIRLGNDGEPAIKMYYGYPDAVNVASLDSVHGSPISYYYFNDVSDYIVDEKGVNNATINNNANMAFGQPSELGYSIASNGNGYATMPNINMIPNDATYTYMVKFVANGDDAFTAFGGQTGFPGGYVLGYGGDYTGKAFCFSVQGSGDMYYTTTPGNTTHTLICNANNALYYERLLRDGGNGYSGVVPSDAPSFWARHISGGYDQQFSGYIDEFAFWDYSTTPDFNEKMSNYTTPTTVFGAEQDNGAAPSAIPFFSGYVHYANSTPAVGAYVSVANGTHSNVTSADGAGFYNLTGYLGVVTMSASLYDSPHQWVAYATVNATGDVENNFTMQLERRVSGFMLYANGTPAAGLGSAVMLRNNTVGGAGVLNTTDTDAAGAFYLTTYDTGYLWLQAWAADVEQGGDEPAGTAEDVTVNVTVYPYRRVYGSIYYSNGTKALASNVTIQNYLYSSGVLNHSYGGDFDFSTYATHVQLQASEGALLTISNFNLTYNLSTNLIYQNEWMNGTLYMPDGVTPAAGYDVELVTLDHSWFYAFNETAVNGNFSFYAVSGELGICAVACGECQYFNASYEDTPVNLTLAECRAFVYGTASWANGTAIGNATVYVDNLGLRNSTTAYYNSNTTTAANGSYRLQIPYYGLWALYLWDATHVNNYSNVTTYGAYYSYYGVHVYDGVPNNLVLPQTEIFGFAAFDAVTGLPIEDLFVYVWQFPSTLQTFQLTDENGSFFVSINRDTLYSVNVTPSLTGVNSRYLPMSVVFWSNETRYIEFTMTPYAPVPTVAPSVLPPAEQEFSAPLDGWILGFLISLVIGLLVTPYSALGGAVAFLFGLFIFSGMGWLPFYLPIVTGLFMAGIYTILPKEGN